MPYTKSIPYNGDPSRAFARAETALLPNNFMIVEKSTRAITFQGPGMTSNKEYDLRGASLIRVEASGMELTLTAELGGARRLTWFLCIFPFVLCGALALLFSVLPMHHRSGGMSTMPPYVVLLLIALPWTVIVPFMSILVRRGTKKALDTLLHNMSMASR